MARVFRAFDLELEEPVALKLFSHPADDATLQQRFRGELKLARQIAHPNVVRLYDLGQEHGRRYLTMELLEGETLKALFKSRGALPIAHGLDLLRQACAGLQAVHDAGIVHRDVKPDNFLVTRLGALKLMDFGIAKQRGAHGVTQAGQVGGTPWYMSPEQISAFSEVGPAADLYALGVMAFEMFTGKLPFDHPDLVPLLMLHLQNAPPAPRELNAEIPLALEALILALLEKDPGRRPGSASELAMLLDRVRPAL